MKELCGFHNQIARVDLSERKVEKEGLTESEWRGWVGGSGLGVRYLRDGLPRGCAWDSEANRLIIAAGPLSGTGFSGAGGFSAVGIGPMTGFAGCSQANGYYGAYMRRSGLDALIIDSKSDEWVYLLVGNGEVQIRGAGHLLGLDTFETEAALQKELSLKPSQLSVYCIGPAGENLVDFACLVGDAGHVASKNGLGAVLGAKKVKAIAALNGKARVRLHDPEAFNRVRKAAARASVEAYGGMFHKHGTGILVHIAHESGVLPVKNYQTNRFADFMALDAQVTRRENSWQPETCFACRAAHCARVTIARGPYAGLNAPEPEYEAVAAFGSQIMVSDYGSVVHLATLADRLGLDANEMGWVLGFVMEAYEKGRLSAKDLDGLEPAWGNAEAAAQLMGRIARRQGIGDLLAGGARKAVDRLGDWAREMAIYVQDGTTPRGHDHRGRWSELLDSCVSNTSTIESTFGGPPSQLLGQKPVTDPFDPLQVARANAKASGWRLFDDSLVACRFAVNDPGLIMDGFNAVTGWDWGLDQALRAGRRITNALRQIKLAAGVGPEAERPSARYGSVPQDGPCQGRDIGPHLDEMRRVYYETMGWDPQSGEPLPETLDSLDLE